MEASKESCQKAIDMVKGGTLSVEDSGFVYNFLLRALRKLPSQEAINKDRQRGTVAKAAKEGYESGKKKPDRPK